VGRKVDQLFGKGSMIPESSQNKNLFIGKGFGQKRKKSPNTGIMVLIPACM
jgi:hypothetical protein